MMKELLTQSKNYKLFCWYEEAFIEGSAITKHTGVGDFYGSVECGYIDWNEKWCITGGNGLIIYNLLEPFESYQYNQTTPQWKELWRNDKDWYVETIYQIDDETVRLVIDIFSKAKGVYDLNINSLKLTKHI